MSSSHPKSAQILRAAGIKVHNFVHELLPASELLDPVPCLIAADWHMRNPDKNNGLLSLKSLSCLIKIGWHTLEDVRRYFDPYDHVALAHYNNRLRLDER